jgi:hypothetical protein
VDFIMKILLFQQNLHLTQLILIFLFSDLIDWLFNYFKKIWIFGAEMILMGINVKSICIEVWKNGGRRYYRFPFGLAGLLSHALVVYHHQDKKENQKLATKLSTTRWIIIEQSRWYCWISIWYRFAVSF